MTNSDPQGVLTDTDKKWLKGEIEYPQRQSAYSRRKVIRKRVGLALQDFEILTDNWSSEQSQQVLEDLDTPEQYAAAIIEFLYVFLNEPATDAEKMVNESATEQPLAFRRALRRGIRSGKEHFDNDPGTVVIDSNTELFELPSVDDIQSAIDIDQWSAANDYNRDAANMPDDAVIDRDEAAKDHHMDMYLQIETELYRRRKRPDIEVDRHDELVQPLGIGAYREDNE